jgi:hypothetical protein
MIHPYMGSWQETTPSSVHGSTLYVGIRALVKMAKNGTFLGAFSAACLAELRELHHE